jgi:hypothetical protein
MNALVSETGQVTTAGASPAEILYLRHIPCRLLVRTVRRGACPAIRREKTTPAMIIAHSSRT